MREKPLVHVDHLRLGQQNCVDVTDISWVGGTTAGESRSQFDSLKQFTRSKPKTEACMSKPARVMATPKVAGVPKAKSKAMAMPKSKQIARKRPASSRS